MISSHFLGSNFENDIDLGTVNLPLDTLPSSGEKLPDLTDIYGEQLLSTDGQISRRNGSFYQRCLFCNVKPILSDYTSKLSVAFDSKFLLSVFMFCIVGIVIMNV